MSAIDHIREMPRNFMDNIKDPVAIGFNAVASALITGAIWFVGILATGPKPVSDADLGRWERDITDRSVSATALADKGFVSRSFLGLVQSRYGEYYLDGCRDIYLKEDFRISANPRRPVARQISNCVYTAAQREHSKRTDKATEVAVVVARVGIEVLAALASSDSNSP